MKEREPRQKPMYMGSEEITICGGNEGVRWMSGVTKMNRIRNERIRGIAKVGETSKKVQENSFKSYGYVGPIDQRGIM